MGAAAVGTRCPGAKIVSRSDTGTPAPSSSTANSPHRLGVRHADPQRPTSVSAGVVEERRQDTLDEVALHADADRVRGGVDGDRQFVVVIVGIGNRGIRSCERAGDCIAAGPVVLSCARAAAIRMSSVRPSCRAL